MSYQYIWGGVIPTNYFRIHSCGIQGCPEECSEHEPYCFKGVAPAVVRKVGHISLVDLVDVTKIPGPKVTILELSVKALISNFVWGHEIQDNSIRIIADGVKIFEKLIYRGDTWKLNKWAVNKDIRNVNKYDLDLSMDISGHIGWATLHNSEITLLGDMWSDIKPPTASVDFTVINKDNLKPINKARVSLMVGATIKAEGYTNSTGNIAFKNMDEGSYTANITVAAGGYYELNQAISVKAPASRYTVKLVPIPTTPIPDLVWYAVAGVAAVGTIIAVPAIIKSRKKPEERIIMVR